MTSIAKIRVRLTAMQEQLDKLSERTSLAQEEVHDLQKELERAIAKIHQYP